MRRLIASTLGALLLVALMVAPTLAHTATATCDHITLGNVPNGVSATLTPGPIVISPPNKTTSINGTYKVPPATYRIDFSDGSIIHRITVPSCPSPSPSTSPTPTPTGSSTPSPSPVPSPSASVSPSTPPSSSPTPSSSPSGASTPTPTPVVTPTPPATPTPTPSSGQVQGATATPRPTVPATDTLADSGSDGLSAGLPILLLLLVGINVSLTLLLRTQGRPGGRRQG
jgi:hypothetical protein